MQIQKQEQQNGLSIAIHCRCGIARTGIIACCLLVEHGPNTEAAISTVSKSRGCVIPDSDEQKEFIKQYAKYNK